MLADEKLFTHTVIDAQPGAEWPPRDATGRYLSGQHRFIWSSDRGWLFTGLQATIDFAGDERLRALVQNQLYVRFLCGDKVQSEMCGVHLVGDVDRRFFEVNAEMTERRVITEAEVPFCDDPALDLDTRNRAPVLHGRLCMPVAVSARQCCELDVLLYDCGGTSLALELMGGGRRLIAIDVYGNDVLGHGPNEVRDPGGGFHWDR